VVNAQADAQPSKAGNIATLWAHYMNRMPEISTGHHTPSLKRKDRHTTEVALSEQGLYPFEPGASASAFALSR